MKRKLIMLLACSMLLCTTLSLPAIAEETHAEKFYDSAVESRSISISDSFALRINNRWEKTFDTAVLFDDDHNAFNVVLTDVSGTYKVQITGDDGYSYTSEKYTDEDMTFTTTGASGSVEYTVSIINSGPTSLIGNVKISSYYN